MNAGTEQSDTRVQSAERFLSTKKETAGYFIYIYYFEVLLILFLPYFDSHTNNDDWE
jgi:hypothetical protein